MAQSVPFSSRVALETHRPQMANSGKSPQSPASDLQRWKREVSGTFPISGSNCYLPLYSIVTGFLLRGKALILLLRVVICGMSTQKGEHLWILPDAMAMSWQQNQGAERSYKETDPCRPGNLRHSTGVSRNMPVDMLVE